MITEGEWKVEYYTNPISHAIRADTMVARDINNPDDAKLIAAAPKLLESCKQARNAFVIVSRLMYTPEGKAAIGSILGELEESFAEAEKEVNP